MDQASHHQPRTNGSQGSDPFAPPPVTGRPPAEQAVPPPPGPPPGYQQPPPGYQQPPPGYQQPPPGPGQPAPGYPLPAPGRQPVQVVQPPQPYHHGLRRPQGGNLWRGLLTIAMLGFGFFVLQFPVSVVILLQSDIDWTGPDPLSDLSITPVGLLAANLSLALLWPLSLGIQRLLYGARPGTLHSVAGRIRWRLFFILAGVLVPAYLAYILLTELLMPSGRGVFTATHAAFIVVALLTTPFQSAGEEVAFRGLLHRAVGGWFASHRVGLVVGALVSSILFAVAHGAGDWWLNAYYFVFGAAMVVITWRTQGLGGAIIAHAANNTFLMVMAAILGQSFDGILDREAGVGGPFMLIAMAMCVIAAALVWWRTGTAKAREAMQLPEGITPNP